MSLSPALAFTLTLLGYVVALRVFPALGLLDFPERYGLKRGRIPYPAGVIAILVFLGFLPFLTPMTQKEFGLVSGIVLLGVTSFIDDRRPLPSSVRLLVQVIAAFLVFASGSRIYTITNPFGGFLKLDDWVISTPLFGSLPVLSGIFTVAWLLLTINALNWFDGITGQVSVVSAVGFLMLGLLADFRNGQPELATLSYVLSAIAAAGILFDLPPAKLLLGDTGSMFFGFLLGLLGVYQGGKVATAFLALGIPLLDAAFVIVSRLLRKSSPFKGGRDHLHHKLVDAGVPERTVVLGTALLGAVFGGTALFLSTAGKGIAFVVLFILMALTQSVLKKKRN